MELVVRTSRGRGAMQRLGDFDARAVRLYADRYKINLEGLVFVFGWEWLSC